MTRKRVRHWGAAQMILVAAFFHFTGACSPTEMRTHPGETSGNQNKGAVTLASGTMLKASPMNNVLGLWMRGRTDDAVARFLALDRTASKREETFCLVAISEDDYLQLPCEQRVGVQGMLGESYTKARIFARQIVRRARKTWAQGDHRRALELLDALEAFGAGNTGPHVTRYADLVGKAIVRVAGETRKELQEAGSN